MGEGRTFRIGIQGAPFHPGENPGHFGGFKVIFTQSPAPLNLRGVNEAECNKIRE